MLTDRQKGRRAEGNVRTVLEYLKEHDVIRGYRQTRLYSHDDRRGIDFFIFTETERIPLQVKSSNAYAERHAKWSSIACVCGFWPMDKLLNTLLHLVGTRQRNAS
jgi:hypothetical protein